MKITWLGERTFRVQIGGNIIALAGEIVPQPFDRAELLSGSDLVIDPERLEELPQFDADNWRPLKPSRPIDDNEVEISAYAIGGNGLFFAAGDDQNLALAWGKVPVSRYLIDSVVVLVGHDATDNSLLTALGRLAGPKMTALALKPLSDKQFADIAAALDGGPLQAMEIGLALEA